MSRTLRCYVYGHGTSWQGICIDFDIAVHGRSQEHVKDRLRDSVELFLSDVLELPTADQRQLLKRTSPWYVRAKLACMASLPWSPLGRARLIGFPVTVHRTAHA